MTIKNKIYFIIFMTLEFIGLLFFLGFIVTRLEARRQCRGAGGSSLCYRAGTAFSDSRLVFSIGC
jgi:hypothetical protein